MLVLEYHPQGFMEKTGNLWRAQGRRARLELKHFQRHVMTHTLLEKSEDVDRWCGEIHDSEVVKTHEDAVAEEQRQREGISGSTRTRGTSSGGSSRSRKTTGGTRSSSGSSGSSRSKRSTSTKSGDQE